MAKDYREERFEEGNKRGIAVKYREEGEEIKARFYWKSCGEHQAIYQNLPDGVFNNRNVWVKAIVESEEEAIERCERYAESWLEEQGIDTESL